ncbi:Protein MARD1, partial [Mucuna pruriens]
MAFSSSSPSIPEKYKKLLSSFLSSPKLFANFTSKVLCETEAVMSPTSILDSKPFSGLKNPFCSETNSPRTPVGEHKRYLDSKGLVDALVDDNKGGEITSNSQSRIVLFGSQLKIQNPPLPHATLSSPSQSPKSALPTSKSQRLLTGYISASEMELSEDYTRVITHGPNPRTTHIFDNCIVDSGCFDIGCSSSPMENVFLPPHISYPSESFMTFCFYCNKNLEQDMDIYMYRGEKAFCSRECRDQGMLLEEEMNKLEGGDINFWDMKSGLEDPGSLYLRSTSLSLWLLPINFTTIW